jgi:hypothetical protein
LMQASIMMYYLLHAMILIKVSYSHAIVGTNADICD